jgi:hypothetical protein
LSEEVLQVGGGGMEREGELYFRRIMAGGEVDPYWCSIYCFAQTHFHSKYKSKSALYTKQILPHMFTLPRHASLFFYQINDIRSRETLMFPSTCKDFNHPTYAGKLRD